MKYYNEARSERRIRVKAFFLTTFILAITISGFALATSESAQNLLPDSVQEWFKGETPDEDMPKKKSKRA